MIRSRVAGATVSGRLKARDTVMGATSASRATSRTPIRLVWRVLFRFIPDMEDQLLFTWTRNGNVIDKSIDSIL
jgi:hypothetical protein